MLRQCARNLCERRYVVAAGAFVAVLLVGMGGEAVAQPAINAVSPATVFYDISPNTSVAISGSGFQLGATITVGSLTGTTVSGTIASASSPFVFSSASTLRFYWDNASLAPGAYDVVVTNPTGDTVTRAGGFTVSAPQPIVDPSSAISLSYGITNSQAINIYGSGFVVGAYLNVGGILGGPVVAGTAATATNPFIFINSGRLQFYWPNTSLPVGSHFVLVGNQPEAGGLQGGLANAVTILAPTPTVSSVSPSSVTYAITGSRALTITGTNFVAGARITIGGLSGVTVTGPAATAMNPYVFVNDGRLSVWWPNTALAPGAYAVTVENPAAAGGETGTLANAFTVTAPQPTIVGTSPNPVTYDLVSSRAISILGTNFVAGAEVTIGTPSTSGACSLPTCARGTTVVGVTATATVPFVFVQDTRLSFYWADTAWLPGSYRVTVANPASAGGASVQAEGAFTILGPQPQVATVTPSSVEYNVTASTSVRITGLNFYEPRGSDASLVTVGPFTVPCALGAGPATPTAPCVHIDRRTIDFYWAQTALPPGVYTVRVTNPVYAGAVSGDRVDGFTVTAPRPKIQAIRPLGVVAGLTVSRAIDVMGVDDPAQHFGFVAGATLHVDDPVTPAQSLVCTAQTGTVPTAANPCVYVGPGLLRFYWDTDRSVAPVNPLLGPGFYDVTVINPAHRGGLDTETPGRFRVLVTPELINVEPTTGVGSGARGAVVTLITAGFPAGSVVRIGTAEPDPTDANAPPYVQAQDSQVIMRSAFRAFAAGDGGTVVIDVVEAPAQAASRELAVTITSPDGRYRFTCSPATPGVETCKSGLTITPSPVITGITPAVGVGASGRTLGITGQRFVAGETVVAFPTGVMGSCLAESASSIACTNVAVAASVQAGAGSVAVINPDGGRTTGALTINAPPEISSVSPASGAAGTTVRVRIAGAGFQSGLALASEPGVTVEAVALVNANAVDADFVLANGAVDGYRALTLTNPDGGVAAAPQAFYIGAPPSDTLGALATFGEHGQPLVQYQRSLGAAWSARFQGPALASSPVWQVMRANPVRNERVLAVVDDQRRLTLHVWNGQSWVGSLAAASSTGLARPTQTVDVAFEQLSGRGVVVYATTDTTLRYRVWDGSSWGPEALVEDLVNGQPTSGRPLWLRVEARPGTNDLVLAYEDANDDVAAFVWDGNAQSWGDAILLTTAAPGHDMPLVDVAFERATGRALVAWAAASDPAGRPRYRLWNGGWGAEAMAQLGAGSDTETVTALRVVGDHASNRIALASGDGAALVVQMWDGGQWIGAGSGAPFTVTSEMAAEGRGRSFDLAWEGGSGDLTAVYSPRSLTDGVSRSWSSTGGWTAPAPLPAPAAETIVATILSSAIAAADASVLVVANAALPDTGLIRIDAELIRYSTRTSNAAGTALTLGGLTRGEFGSVAAAHAAGAAVEHVPYPAWFDLAAARGVDEAALASLDTQGRVVLRRWNGAAWTAAVEAQAQGAGLVAVFDPALARTSLAAGRAIAATLAQHLAGPGPGITPPSTVPDTTPPAAPTLGAGSPGVTSVLLSWTAVGDDGTTGGMVARYELRRSFGTLSAVQQVAAVAAPGATEQFTASGLDGGTTYTFELRAIDDAGNASAWSSPTIVTTAVDQPPTAVTLSLAAAPTTNAITIQWTVPPDDSGPIAGYLVRYSAGASFNFDTATPYTLHLPTVVGSNATLAIQGLLPATSYAIAVKAVDAAAQVGASSNVLIATTAVGSSADVTPPAAVTDLAVFGGATTSNSLLLQWTATGDPVGAGTFRRARAYEVRYATVPLTADNFSQGTLVGSNPPGLPGGAQELLVGGLSPNATYYFALVVVDGSGNRSPLSNVVMGRTALRRGYTIVSVPLLLTNPNTPDAVFGDDVGIPPYAYRWNSTGPAVSDGCYAGTVSQPAFPTCASLTAIETGAAYYLYSAGNRAVLDATGSAVTAPTFEVPLALGFNMVGNPYGREIPLSAIRVKRASSEVSFAVAVAQGWVSGAIYLYDGAAHQAYGPADPEAVFRPWNGAWIQSSVADAILVFEQP